MQSEERPPIRLDQFLKHLGAVGTGGHAKVVIQAGEVTLNGAVETRRRKQLSPGDIVAYAGEEWCVE
jgi:ribosome-associated protein